MHPLVTQLHFARSEFVRSLAGITDEDARTRIEPMNCITWNIGHLANHEQSLWVYVAQGKALYPDLHKLVGNGSPASTPPLDEMWAIWGDVTKAADDYLSTVTTETLETHFMRRGEPMQENIGTCLLRNIYHYWYHCGESAGIRQALGHTDLPQFVGDMLTAIYRPE